MSTRDTFSSSNSPAQDDLASWVRQIRQRNSSIPLSNSQSTTSFSPTTSASDLELELQRQKQQRQERRARLSVSGVRGLSSQSSSPLPTPTSELSLSLDYTGMLPTSESSNPSHPGSSPTKVSGVTGIRRANSFLARYGGQTGPTGVAAGPTGGTDSPVSLASFMGGKVAGPRLGKLTGDGKSVPPEAELIHENRSVALPGLANPAAEYGGRSLASFLGDRADSLGHQRPVKTMSTSPIKSSPTITAPIRSATADDDAERSASPAKYGFSQADLGRPGKAVSDTQSSSSPKKAYLDLMEKQQSNTPVSPVTQRASSPSKFHRFGGNSVPASPRLERPASPVKQHSYRDSNSAASRPLLVPGGQTNLQTPLNSIKKDVATSPIKPEDLAAIKAETNVSAQTPKIAHFNRSSDGPDADRMPTSTLTRLNAKQLVGQRVKEAQLRDAAAQKELDSLQIGSGRSIPSSPAVRERWPPSSFSSHNLVSPSKQKPDDTKRSAWSPTKYGNALPGLATNRSPIKEDAASPWSSPSLQKEPRHAEERAEPVRLPGMTSGVPPFERAKMTENQSLISQTSEDGVLTSLTKARARGPVRRGPVKSSESPVAKQSKGESSSVEKSPQAAETATLSSKPLRRTSGPRIHVLISGSGSNLQSLIDATLTAPPPGLPAIENGQITFVMSNRKAAYGLTRAAESNPPIPTKVLALKTWQNRNPGGTREEYDQVLARAVLDGADEQGNSPPPDLIVLAGFMHIVSESFLHALGHETGLPRSTPTLGRRPSIPVPIINLHPALPHAFDGANAIPRALEAYQQGLVNKTGCMVHEVVADVDRGRPIIIKEVPILPSYTLESLEEAIHKIEHVIIVQAADLVLKGYLEQLDSGASAERDSTQSKVTRSRTASDLKASAAPRDLTKLVRIREQHDGNPVATASSLILATNADWEKYALSSACVSQQAPSPVLGEDVSIEVFSISADGGVTKIQSSQTSIGVRPEQTVFEDEIVAIVGKSKSAATQLWVRAGLTSALHPFELGPMSTSCPEGRRIAELSQKFAVKPRFVPAGCEDPDLISLMGDSWLMTNLGSRHHFDASAPSLYRVRQAVTLDPEAEECFSISQVAPTRASVSSGDSFVSFLPSSRTLWHGKGSCVATRRAAARFANALVRASSSSNIVELSEDQDDEHFWTTLQDGRRSASAWYHGTQAHVPKSTICSLLDIELQQGQLVVSPHLTRGYFGTDDLLLPTRNESISILNLEDRELFVVVGSDARSDKVRIAVAIQIAQRVAMLIQDCLRSLIAIDDTIVARPAVHVIILPSQLPQEIRAAARIWSDEVVEYLQGPSAVQMNVHSDEQALYQLQRDTWALWQLQDSDCLPVGVAPADIQQGSGTADL